MRKVHPGMNTPRPSTLPLRAASGAALDACNASAYPVAGSHASQVSSRWLAVVSVLAGLAEHSKRAEDPVSSADRVLLLSKPTGGRKKQLPR